MPTFVHASAFTILAKARLVGAAWQGLLEVVADDRVIVAKLLDDCHDSEAAALADACFDGATLANYLAWEA